MADTTVRMKELTAKLEEGVKSLFDSDKYAEYLRLMAQFYRYSFRNTMLIYLQKPDASRVAGYHDWQNKYKRQVRKGEHGIQILAPISFKTKKEVEKLDPATKRPIIGEDGTPEREEVEVMAARFKVVPVFDISQTTGEPLPELAETLTGDVARYELFMDALRAVSPLPMYFEPMDDKDGYCKFGEKIGIREDMSQKQTVAAAIHEITHAKLHDKNVELDETGKRADRRMEEVQAESVSYIVCQHFGIETGANSLGYIADWSTNPEAKELYASLNVINKAAAELIDAIDEQIQVLSVERGVDWSVVADEVGAEQNYNMIDGVINNAPPVERNEGETPKEQSTEGTPAKPPAQPPNDPPAEPITAFRGENYFLSNFCPCAVIYGGVEYTNAEAAFQAAKCANDADREKFVGVSAPSARRLGNTVALRPDWEDVKVDVMREIIASKFALNADIAEQLRATGSAALIEGNGWHDNFWGSCTCARCANVEGLNMLGKILMDTRETLVRERAAEQADTTRIPGWADIPLNDHDLVANIQSYIQSSGGVMDISDYEIYQAVLAWRERDDKPAWSNYRDVAEFMLKERERLEPDPVRDKLAALSDMTDMDAKHNYAVSVLVGALCQNEQLLALAGTGAEWQEGAGRSAVFEGEYCETLIEEYRAELGDLADGGERENKLRYTVEGDAYRRLDAIAYDRYVLDEYAAITKSGRLETYETPYPEGDEHTGVLVHLTEQLPDGNKHDYGYIFGYDPNNWRDHAINNYMSLKSFAGLREGVFGKTESTVKLNYTETAPEGSTVLRRLLFEDGMFNRELKRTRVEVLPPMGKYSVYAQHLSGVTVGDDTLIHIGTDSGYLIPLGIDRTKFEAGYFEARIDHIFETAGARLDAQLAVPERFAHYDLAAITGRFEEAEAHNTVYKGIKAETDRQNRATISEHRAAVEKEAKREHAERIKTNAETLASGKMFTVGADPYSGRNNLLELFSLYDIDVPLATKGWFNNKLVRFEASEDGGFRYWSNRNKDRSKSLMGDTGVTKLTALKDAVQATPIVDVLTRKGLIETETPEPKAANLELANSEAAELEAAESDAPETETTTPEMDEPAANNAETSATSVAERENGIVNGGPEQTELQLRGLEIAKKYESLSLWDRMNVLAVGLGAKTATYYTEPCRGKYRGYSDIMLKLDNGAVLGIGMKRTTEARKHSVISECVNKALAEYSPEIVAETKARAAAALKAREAADNIVAAEHGLKPYKFLTVEMGDGSLENAQNYLGWYYVTLAVDNKVFGFVETGLKNDIARGALSERISRPNFFTAGLRESEADFAFNNVGHSSFNGTHQVELSAEVRERAEKTLAELLEADRTDEKDDIQRVLDAFAEKHGFGKLATEFYSYQKIAPEPHRAIIREGKERNELFEIDLAPFTKSGKITAEHLAAGLERLEASKMSVVAGHEDLTLYEIGLIKAQRDYRVRERQTKLRTNMDLLLPPDKNCGVGDVVVIYDPTNLHCSYMRITGIEKNNVILGDIADGTPKMNISVDRFKSEYGLIFDQERELPFTPKDEVPETGSAGGDDLKYKSITASFGNDNGLAYRVYLVTGGEADVFEVFDADFKQLPQAATTFEETVSRIIADGFTPMKMDINDSTVFEGETLARFVTELANIGMTVHVDGVQPLTPDDKDFWRDLIAETLAANDGKLELEDLELAPFDSHGGLRKFYRVFGEDDYKQDFANIVAEENARRTGEPWVTFNFCEGGAYRPDCLKTPTALSFAEADAFIKGYEPKVREILQADGGGCDKLDYTVYYKRGDNEMHHDSERYDIGAGKSVSGLRKAIAADNVYTNDSGKRFSIGMGHLGNGLSVWNRLEERNGDYVNIAHISKDRKVSLYANDLPQAVIDLIEHEARTCDISISATQNTPVFSSPPDGHVYAIHFYKDSGGAEFWDGAGDRERYIGRINDDGSIYYARDNTPDSVKEEIEKYAAEHYGAKVAPAVTEEQPKLVGSLVYNDSGEVVEYFSADKLLAAYKSGMGSQGPESVYYKDVTDKDLERQLYAAHVGEYGEEVGDGADANEKQYALAMGLDDSGVEFVYNMLDETTDNEQGYTRLAEYYRDKRKAVLLVDGLPDKVQSQILELTGAIFITSGERGTPAKTGGVADKPAASAPTPPPKVSEDAPKPAPAYILPDPTLTIADMNKFGYMDDSMLPLSHERALQLRESGKTVYLIYPENTESMVWDADEITRHDGLCAIERVDWEKAPEYLLKLAETKTDAEISAANDEGKRESELLYDTTRDGMFGIYQLRDGVESTRDVRFASMQELEALGLTPDRADYELVYIAPMAIHDTLMNKHKIYNEFQHEHPDCPADFTGRSVSVSDVIVLQWRGEVSAHYVDSAGFKELAAFTGCEREQTPQPFSQVGKSSEPPTAPAQSANPTIPTVADLRKEVEAGRSISVMDLARAVEAENGGAAQTHGNGERKGGGHIGGGQSSKGKPSFLGRLKDNEQRVAAERQSSAAQQPSIDAPKPPNNREVH